MTSAQPRIVPFSRLACPIDGTSLEAAEGGALRCANGHSYDRARAGYHNLLVVQHKASRDPGDSKDMVAARRRILDAGHYRRIAEPVSALALRLAAASGSQPFSILDAGCGEGYYLAAIAAAAAVTPAGGGGPLLALSGIDISKWAVQAAARRPVACFWAVASNRHLPFAPASIDLVVSMFGFPLWDAFAAAQPPGGCVLLVDPGPDHLIELRRIIYPSVTAKPPPALHAAEKAGYRLEDEQRLRFQVELAGAAAIADLLAMTPHGHKAGATGREALTRCDHLHATIDVTLRLVRRSVA